MTINNVYFIYTNISYYVYNIYIIVSLVDQFFFLRTLLKPFFNRRRPLVNTFLSCNLSTLPTLHIILPIDVPYRCVSNVETRINAYGQQVSYCERSSAIKPGQQCSDGDYNNKIYNIHL